jgi:hypothetical protein
VSDNYAISLAYLTSLAVGLLIGLERERHREAKAGVRTFALIALLGTLCAMLGEKTQSPWLWSRARERGRCRPLTPPRPTPVGTTTVSPPGSPSPGAAVWLGTGIVIAVASW